MASELRVNTLKDASGNNSIATSFVAGGSAKAYIRFNAGTSINGSFNVASLTDDGTGDYHYNLRVLWVMQITLTLAWAGMSVSQMTQ